jgi:hypothetical protein
MILFCAVTLSRFLGHTFEAEAFAVIVLFAVSLAFYQEYRAEARQPGIRLFIQPTEWSRLPTIQQSIPWKKHLPFHGNRLAC